MHTDEYEISLGRECNHCRHLVKKIRTDLARRQQRYDLTYEQAVVAREQGKISITDKELAKWREDAEALPIWQKRLTDYLDALASMQISAPDSTR